MSGGARVWRVAAGAAVLVAMAAIGFSLLPAYLENRRLQQLLDRTVASGDSLLKTDETLRAEVAQGAIQLGLPVTADQVRVLRRDEHLRLEVLYFVRVDLPLYTVDLHFHPAAAR